MAVSLKSQYKNIHPKTNEAALEFGIQISLSERKGKKLKVCDNEGNLICHIGNNQMLDYHQYCDLESQGLVPKGYAESRRKSWWARFGHQLEVENSAAYWGAVLLWS